MGAGLGMDYGAESLGTSEAFDPAPIADDAEQQTLRLLLPIGDGNPRFVRLKIMAH